MLASEEAENEENGDKEESSDTDDEDEEQELVKTNNQWTSKGRRNDCESLRTLALNRTFLISFLFLIRLLRRHTDRLSGIFDQPMGERDRKSCQT